MDHNDLTLYELWVMYLYGFNNAVNYSTNLCLLDTLLWVWFLVAVRKVNFYIYTYDNK